MAQLNALGQLENTFDEYLVKKAPFQLPLNVKEALVKFVPWLALIGGIIGLAGALTVFGLGTVFGPLSMFAGPQYARSLYSTYIFSTVLLGVTAVMQLMAFGPLKARKERGWKLLYWSELIWIVASLIDFSFFNAVLGGLISLYLLFQIRSYYK